MKKVLLVTAIFTCCLFQVYSQNNININIHHKLADVDFEMDAAANNNIESTFSVNRLQYYISEISLIHDGGTETLFEDLWILVNAESLTEVDLGEYDISSVEKIKFHIGVNEEYNHLDPSTYHVSHPLGPKSPSMHWGWSAGYRFVAFEGFGGSDLNQTFQFHALGDVNYFTTEIDLDLTAEDNLLTIDLDADYTRILENIDVDGGLIVHGQDFEAKEVLENFRDFVFSSGISSSTIDFSEVQGFNLYPNPVEHNTTTINLDLSDQSYSYDLSITSIDGKQLQHVETIYDGQSIDLTGFVSGMYFVNLEKKGQVVLTNKIFVK